MASDASATTAARRAADNSKPLHDNAARPLAQWWRTVPAAGSNGSKARCMNLSLWFYLLAVIKKMRVELSSLLGPRHAPRNMFGVQVIILDVRGAADAARELC
jgi:hypothetical protein